MQPDESIPGELELASEFNVSRGTVKQAIVELVNEGFLYRIQGKGTFVSPPKIQRSFGRLPTFTDDIRRLGYVAKSKKISLKIIEALEPVRSYLLLQDGSNVIKFKRLVMANEKPVALVTSYLRLDIYPDLKMDDIDDSLYETLNKKYQRVPVKADDTYRPLNANSDLAKTLGIHEGKAILYSERLSYLDNNLPVEYVESYISGDIFALTIKISPENS
jgi:GntR family transcriptional regulator